MATLTNEYSNCFLNAILQLITVSEDIMESFTCSEIVDFFNLYKNGGTVDVIEIMKYYQTINKNIIYGRQHDAVDTLVYILDQCSDKSQFLIDIHQKVFNKKFKNNSNEYEIEISSKNTEETILSIPIKENISDSLEEYFKDVDEDIYEIEREIEELVDEEFVKRKIKIIKTSPKINYNPNNSPNYLFLSLKRFDHELNKDNSSINISNGITYNSTHYNVIGYVIHIGSIEGGHYVTVKITSGIWFIYDDIVKKEISESDGLHLQSLAYIYIFVKDELYHKFSK